MVGTPPDVAPLAHGFQYLSEVRLDEPEPAIDLIREGALALDLPLRRVEIEFGPSQVEFTFPQWLAKKAQTSCCFSDLRPSKFVKEMVTMRVLCADQDYKMSLQADGICISHWLIQAMAKMPLLRINKACRYQTLENSSLQEF